MKEHTAKNTWTSEDNMTCKNCLLKEECEEEAEETSMCKYYIYDVIKDD